MTGRRRHDEDCGGQRAVNNTACIERGSNAILARVDDDDDEASLI